MSGTSDPAVLRAVDATRGYSYGTLMRQAVASLAGIDMQDVAVLGTSDAANATRAETYNATDSVNGVQVTTATYRRRAAGLRDGRRLTASSACTPGTTTDGLNAAIQLYFSPSFLAAQGLAGRSVADIVAAVTARLSQVTSLVSGGAPHPAVNMLQDAFQACTGVRPSVGVTVTTQPEVVLPPAHNDDDDSGLSAGAIAGIAVGCSIAFLCCCLWVVFVLCRRRRQEKRTAEAAVVVPDVRAEADVPSKAGSAEVPVKGDAASSTLPAVPGAEDPAGAGAA